MMAIKDLLRKIKRRGGLKFIPDKMYYSITYRMHCKGRMNWKNPRTYSEKLNWLKLYDRRDIYHTIVDKYNVRNYVEQKINEDIMIPCFGVFDSFDQIDFDSLPDVFVLKCTHDSGSVRIIHKEGFNYEEEKKFFEERLKIDFFHYSGREWPYKGLKPRIIAEKFLETKDRDGLTNYKFHCFNGEPRFVVAEKGFNADHSVKLDHYDFDFNLLPFCRPEHLSLGTDVEKPKNIDHMLKISRVLSKNIPYLRVDLYEIDGEVFFSEMTLYPGAGFVWYQPDEYNYVIGDMIEIDELKKR